MSYSSRFCILTFHIPSPPVNVLHIAPNQSLELTFLGDWIPNDQHLQMRDMCLCASSSDHKVKLMAKSAAVFTVIIDVNKPASGKHE